MKTLVRILITAVSLLPAGAGAATVLASVPLQPGPGGLVCSCGNLTEDTFVVSITMQALGGSTSCNNLSLSGGGGPVLCSVGGTSMRVCVVRRQDGRPASAKELACALATLDTTGSTTAVVPVDKKRKE